MTRIWASTLSILVVLAAWEVLPGMLRISPLILPTFSGTLEALWAAREAVANRALETAWATLEAMVFAMAAALFLACITTMSSKTEAFLSPLIVGGQALPKVVLIPALFLLIDDAEIPAVIIGALIAFFPVYITLRYSFETIPTGLRDLVRVWGYDRRRMVFVVGIPYALPAAVSTVRLAWIYALIGVVSVELLHPARGIGFLLDHSQAHFDGTMFYGVAVVSLAISLLGWFAASIADTSVRRRFRLATSMEMAG